MSELMHSHNVGDIFVNDDGYFFQAVSVSRTGVRLRPIERECLGTVYVRTCFDTDVAYRAKPDCFTTYFRFNDKQNSTGKFCKTTVDGSDHVVLDGAWREYAWPTDGYVEVEHYLR